MSKKSPYIISWIVSIAVALSAQGLDAQARDRHTVAGVSPGFTGRGHAGGRLVPDLSWSGSDRATGYEVVVYRLTETTTLEEALRTRVQGGAAGSWTPGATQCLDSGASYAWAVRALSHDGPSAWSDLLQFEIAGLPSADEVRHALQTLRRYRAGREDGVGPGNVGAGLAPAREGWRRSDGSDGSDARGRARRGEALPPPPRPPPHRHRGSRPRPASRSTSTETCRWAARCSRTAIRCCTTTSAPPTTTPRSGSTP